MQHEPAPDADRLLLRVLRDVLARESFDTIADLADALKCRCARLRIPYDGARINHAIDVVAASRSLVRDDTPRPAPAGDVPDAVDNRPLSHDEVAALLRDRLHATPRAMPTAPVDATHAARVQRQAAAFRRVRPPRRPIAERLDEIFGGADAEDRQRQRERDEIDAAIDAATRRTDGDA